MSVLIMTAYLEIRCVTCVPYLIFQHSCWKHICKDPSGSWSKQRFFMDHVCVCVWDWRQDGPNTPNTLLSYVLTKSLVNDRWAVTLVRGCLSFNSDFRLLNMYIYTKSITPILLINCTAHATSTHSHIEYFLGPHDTHP